jgi:polyhydroxyalkanoate synthase
MTLANRHRDISPRHPSSRSISEPGKWRQYAERRFCWSTCPLGCPALAPGSTFQLIGRCRRAAKTKRAGPKASPPRSTAATTVSEDVLRERDYGGDDRSLSLLIIATPIKRAYIWDLAPFVSAVRYCIRAGLHVHLLEWMPASQPNQNNGLDEYTAAISECVARLSGEAAGTTPFLVGHSLGGTLAAIFTAWAPASIRGLILLGAPLCFEPATSRFRDALVSLIPPVLPDGDPFPGSLLSFIATLASPGTFIWSMLP